MGHPCQAAADILTMKEKTISLNKRKITITWVNHPDPQSLAVPHSVILACSLFGMDIRIAHPIGYELDTDVLEKAEKYAKEYGGTLEIFNDMDSALKDTEFVYAKSWGSIKMWNEPERERILTRSFMDWIVDKTAMEKTRNAYFMHPLPVRRNLAVTDEVLDGKNSIVYDQAENRLHFQKALLVHLI